MPEVRKHLENGWHRRTVEGQIDAMVTTALRHAGKVGGYDERLASVRAMTIEKT